MSMTHRPKVTLLHITALSIFLFFPFFECSSCYFQSRCAWRLHVTAPHANLWDSLLACHPWNQSICFGPTCCQAGNNIAKKRGSNFWSFLSWNCRSLAVCSKILFGSDVHTYEVWTTDQHFPNSSVSQTITTFVLCTMENAPRKESKRKEWVLKQDGKLGELVKVHFWWNSASPNEGREKEYTGHAPNSQPKSIWKNTRNTYAWM